ncbi:MAG: hypothetical protein EOP04_22045 [Proteobacteria bacterium]|nr:MAG: hypothetical protein EOP04_22045 [Pseudomonadota bacterium]
MSTGNGGCAQGGNGLAALNLGLLYDEGKWVTKDEDKALYYFMLAAEAGDAEGAANLAYKYRKGINVKKRPCFGIHV